MDVAERRGEPRRLEMLTLGMLGQLEAAANWRRVIGEWLYGSEPSTDLGREEAAFFGSQVSSLPAA